MCRRRASDKSKAWPTVVTTASAGRTVTGSGVSTTCRGIAFMTVTRTV